jgi:hypothetical protein
MDWATVVTTAFGVAAVIGSTLAGLSVSIAKTNRETVTDLRGRMGDLNTELAEARAEIAELKTANGVLTKTVTGEVHWVALMHLLKMHHEESTHDMKRTIDLLIRVLAVLNKDKP